MMRSQSGPTPPPLPGTVRVTLRHLVGIVWPRTVWMLLRTSLGLLLAGLLVFLGSLYWIVFDRFLNLPGWWGTLGCIALFIVALPLVTLVQFGVVGHTGRVGYASDHAVLVVRVRRPSDKPREDRAADWWLGEHFSWPGRAGHGATFRALVFPQLADAALASDCELVADVRSPRVLEIYQEEGWLAGAALEDRTGNQHWRVPGSPRWAMRWPREALKAMATRQ